MIDNGSSQFDQEPSVNTPLIAAVDVANVSSQRKRISDVNQTSSHALSHEHGVRNELLVIAVFCESGLLSGFSNGFTSAAIADLTKAGRLTEDQASLFASSYFLGCLLGCVLGGILADSCGRKLATMLVIAADAIGWWFIIADFHVPILLAGRSLCGVFSGAVGVLAPMYVVETVSRCRRGRTASASAVISGAGMLLAGGCTLLTLSWRWLAIVALGLNLVFISAVCLLLPESPRWLVKKGKSAEAKESLIWLKMGDQAAVDSELDAITTSFTESQEQQQQKRVSLRRLFTHKRYRIRLMLALLLALGRPMSGQPAIMSFLWQICNKAGLSNAPIISVTVSLLIIITTTAKSFAIDRLSRRVFLGVGGGLLTVSLLLMAFTDISQRQGWATNTAITSIVSLIGILGYFVAFTISWAVLSFLILNEVLPTAIRSFGGGGASAIQQLVNFAVTQVFQQTEKTIQLGYTFIVFAVLNSITTFTVVQLLPDTRNKSLEDIEQHFQRK